MLILNAFVDFFETIKTFVVNIVVSCNNFLLQYFEPEVLTIFGIFISAILVIFLFLKFSNRN